MRVELRDLTVAYGATRALDQISLTIGSGTIVGLLGRNGAGKTTLLSVLAAFRRPTSGVALLDGAVPYENRAVTREVCFIRHGVDSQQSDRVSDVVGLAAR